MVQVYHYEKNPYKGTGQGARVPAGLRPGQGVSAEHKGDEGRAGAGQPQRHTKLPLRA